MFKRDLDGLLEKTMEEIHGLNYVEQFLEIFPGFFPKHLPVPGMCVFFLNNEGSRFVPYLDKKHSQTAVAPLTWESNLAIYLKDSMNTLVFKEESSLRIGLLKKTDPDLFEKIKIDIVIPLLCLKKLYGFVGIEANPRTYKELESITGFFHIFSNIFIPLVMAERAQVKNDINYYQVFRMDRLALVGEMAASAAHEIKNPLAGISTYLKYLTELEDFHKKDIIEALNDMKQSVQRIDETVKSLLSFSRYKKKKITKLGLSAAIESSIHSIALRIPAAVKVIREPGEDLIVETDTQQIQQVLVNILLNAVEAIGEKNGKIIIRTYVSGRDQLPSRELFNISIKDNGPGIDKAFKEKLFQPFRTTKEEGTGLGLYTCYWLMKSLGGTIDITSDEMGTEAILSLPYSFDDEIEEH
jgi:signal transduction histidine kinase